MKDFSMTTKQKRKLSALLDELHVGVTAMQLDRHRAIAAAEQHEVEMERIKRETRQATIDEMVARGWLTVEEAR